MTSRIVENMAIELVSDLRKNVLFICTHNFARSQMAEGILNAFLKDKYKAYSAGIEPTQVHPYAVQVMAEIGIDVSNHRSKAIEEFRGQTFDYVVTVCNKTKEIYPFFPGETVLHNSFKDPSKYKGSKKDILKEFRRVRDKIRNWIVKTFRKTKILNLIRE